MIAPKILVVDDDVSFRRVLEYQLKEAGYSVACAADGRPCAWNNRQGRAMLTHPALPFPG